MVGHDHDAGAAAEAIYAKAHVLSGEHRLEGLKLALAPSVGSKQELGEGTSELPRTMKAKVIGKRGRKAAAPPRGPSNGSMSDLHGSCHGD
jgi:hypothetical protein